MRLHSWEHERPPTCGDLVSESPIELERGFLVVGVEETSKPTAFRVVMERLDWPDFLIRELADGECYWSFTRDRR